MEPINRRQLNNHDLPAEAAVWTYPDRENVNWFPGEYTWQRTLSPTSILVARWGPPPWYRS